MDNSDCKQIGNIPQNEENAEEEKQQKCKEMIAECNESKSTDEHQASTFTALNSSSKQLREILHHPSNTSVIQLFVAVFIAMLIIPTTTVVMLNKYVLNGFSQFESLSTNNKQTISIIIGVLIAHGIALLYLCYALTEKNEQSMEDVQENESEIETEDESDSVSNSDSDHSSETNAEYRPDDVKQQIKINQNRNTNYSQIRKRIIKS